MWNGLVRIYRVIRSGQLVAVLLVVAKLEVSAKLVLFGLDLVDRFLEKGQKAKSYSMLMRKLVNAWCYVCMVCATFFDLFISLGAFSWWEKCERMMIHARLAFVISFVFSSLVHTQYLYSSSVHLSHYTTRLSLWLWLQMQNRFNPKSCIVESSTWIHISLGYAFLMLTCRSINQANSWLSFFEKKTRTFHERNNELGSIATGKSSVIIPHSITPHSFIHGCDHHYELFITPLYKVIIRN